MTYDDIECALLFVSSGAPFEHRAVIQRSTGEIFYASDISEENEFPDDVDVDEGGCYLSIPHKHDLDLGRPLVMEFVQGRCPEQIDRVCAIFSRRTIRLAVSASAFLIMVSASCRACSSISTASRSARTILSAYS